VATGYQSAALGNYSTAMGLSTTASGTISIAIGSQTTASGDFSTAMGSQTTASGTGSIAMGLLTNCSGWYGNTMGRETAASGDFSVAMGYQTNAWGQSSTAMGFGNYAIGQNSTAMGSGTITKAHSSLSVGSYNDNSDYPNGASPYPDDRIFQIGNGYSIYDRRNALTVLRNGMVRIEGSSTSGGTVLSVGGYGDISFDKTGTTGGRFIIKENGNIGISTATPNAPLQFANTAVNRKVVLYETVNNDNQYYGFGINAGKLRYQVDGVTSEHTFYAGTGAGTSQYVFAVHGDGNIFAPGAFTSTSDARLKKNITPLGTTLDKIKELNGYTYNWISPTRDQRQQIGLLAQEVQKLYPQLVTEFKGDNDEPTLGINYLGLIPVLIEGLKEQQKQIDELKKIVAQLAKK
jgi:hypothetical protein